MAPVLIDRYDLLRGVKKLGTWWNGRSCSWQRLRSLDAPPRLHRRGVGGDARRQQGPGQWYADSDSLRYSFFDKVADED